MIAVSSVNNATSAENAGKYNFNKLGSARYHIFTCTRTLSFLKNPCLQAIQTQKGMKQVAQSYFARYNVFRKTQLCLIKSLSGFTQQKCERENTLSLEISEKRHGSPNLSQYSDDGLQNGFQYVKSHQTAPRLHYNKLLICIVLTLFGVKILFRIDALGSHFTITWSTAHHVISYIGYKRRDNTPQLR